MLPVERTSEARADIKEALEYLEARSPAAAETLSDAIQQRCDQLGLLPGLGRSRDELQPGLRSIVVQKYTIFYRVTEVAVQIVRVLHGARDIDTIMREE
jgi:toxin ParE1/3/4